MARSSFGIYLALRALLNEKRFHTGQCRRQDLNLHDPKVTSPSSWRVCQFRHSGRGGYPYLTAGQGGKQDCFQIAECRLQIERNAKAPESGMPIVALPEPIEYASHCLTGKPT